MNRNLFAHRGQSFFCRLFRGLSASSFFKALPRRGMVAAALLGLAGWAQAQSTDLGISTNVSSPVLAGGDVTYSFVVGNYGDYSASNVTFTNTFTPAGVTLASVSAAGCDTSAWPVMTCNLGTLAPHTNTVVTLHVHLPSAGSWSSEAEITTPNLDPTNDVSQRTVTAIAAANLNLTASSDAPTAPALLIKPGQPYHYTLTVDNNAGPDDKPAGSAVVVDFEIPGGASVTAASGSGWTCAPTSGALPVTNDETPSTAGVRVECSRSDALAVGASYPSITVTAAPNRSGTITGTFTVNSAFPDGDASNDTRVVDVLVASDLTADMAITKTSSPAANSQVPLGSNVTYTLTPRLNGGVQPTGIVVTDTLGAGLTYSSFSVADPRWSCVFDGTDTITCTWDGGAAYTGGNYTNLPVITVVAAVTAEGAVINNASITADQEDPDLTNNGRAVTVTGSNKADLSISKTASLNAVMVNENYTFTVSVTNNGPMPIPAGAVITVTDNIPAGMTVRDTVTGAGWTCSPNTPPMAGPVDITCTYTVPSQINRGGALPAITFPVVNTIDGPADNRACVSSTGAPDDDVPGNNCAIPRVYGTTVGADLWLQKAVDKATVAVGDPVTYTITVHNSGPGDAVDVHVNDLLQDGNGGLLLNAAGSLASMTWTNPAGGGTSGDCTRSPATGLAPTLDCAVGDVPANGTATVTITLQLANTTAADQDRANFATVISNGTGDYNRNNNTSNTVTTTVQPRVNVSVMKSVSKPKVRVGEPLVYVITARNDGYSTALNVTTHDVLPLNTAFISLVSVNGGGTCNTPAADAVADGTLAVDCTWASIPAATQRTATFQVRPLESVLDQPAGPTVANDVGIATDSTQIAVPGPDAAEAIATVIPPELNVLVTKTDDIGSGNQLVVGDSAIYTITITNLGPSYGTNLVLTDTFPVANPGNGEPSTASFSWQGELTDPLPEGGVCDQQPALGATSGTLHCTFPLIAPGTPIVLTYKMTAQSTFGQPSGTQHNTVTVGVHEAETIAGGGDPLADNTATASSTVKRGGAVSTDLALTKTIDHSSLRAGDQATYTFLVENKGTQNVVVANGATVTDPLPTGLVFVSSPDGCYLNGAGVVVCDVGDLAAGASKKFSIIVRTDMGRLPPAGTIINEATVTVEGDINPDNDKSRIGASLGSVPIPSLSLWNLLFLLAAVVALGMSSRRKFR